MSILERDALLEATNADPAARGSSGSLTSPPRRTRSSPITEGGRGSRGPGEGNAGEAHAATTTKRLDQEMGFLSVGVYFTVREYCNVAGRKIPRSFVPAGRRIYRRSFVFPRRSHGLSRRVTREIWKMILLRGAGPHIGISLHESLLACILVCCTPFSVVVHGFIYLQCHRFAPSLPPRLLRQFYSFGPRMCFSDRHQRLSGLPPLLVLFFQAPKDPLRRGLGAALAGRLAEQTDQDGLKWHLLKQVLRVRALLLSNLA